ncbi:MAG: AAA family ATPase [Polyangiaceae bacterium]|nr:AAA family ATPase [Polyangiaceae bacterium]
MSESGASQTDWLAERLAPLRERLVRADLADVLLAFFEKELIAEQWSRLAQAGHKGEDRIPLAHVFVDLEVGATSPGARQSGSSESSGALTRETVLARSWERPLHLAPADEIAERTTPLAPGFLATFGANVPPHVDGSRPQDPFGQDGDSQSPKRGKRLLLTGGPGQGKSTLGQFLCQLYRADLVRSAGTAELRASTQKEAQAQGIALAEPRLPFRVLLSDFAAWCSEPANLSAPPEGVPNLVVYLCHRITKRTARRVESADLGAVLQAVPSLFVFDGLDEVSESQARTDVLSNVEALCATFGEADLHVLLTSRPSLTRLDLKGFEQWSLLPLSKKRSLFYASRLAAQKYSSDPEQCERVEQRIADAWQQPNTAHLLTAPLHVALTVLLVEALGPLPEHRWRLFDEHYRVLYHRELEKPHTAAVLLREHRPQIDALHRRVALRLQAESERGTESRSLLTRGELHEIADVIFAEVVEEPHRSRLVSDVIAAATERLVLLVRVEEEPDRFGFELRSLQEYLAAEALLSGKEASVAARLAQIPWAPSFRNVLLFAASKCEALTEFWHLRDTIADLCQPPETVEPEIVVRAAELALDLLEEGFAKRAKKLRDRLVSSALALLSLPPSAWLLRMTDVLDRLAPEALQAALETSAEAPANRMAWWLCVVEPANKGRAWAQTLGDRLWPADAETQRSVVELASQKWLQVGAWLLRKISQNLGSFSPKALSRWSWRSWGDKGSWDEATPLWFWCAFRQINRGEFFGKRQDVRVRSSDPSAASVPQGRVELVSSVDNPLRNQPEFANVDDAWVGALLAQGAAIPPQWRVFFGAFVFSVHPFPQTLASVLNWLAEASEVSDWVPDLFDLPWVLSICLAQAKTPLGLSALARLVSGSSSRLGTAGDWAKWEAAWCNEGVALEQDLPMDLSREPLNGRFPFDVALLYGVSRGFLAAGMRHAAANFTRFSASVALTALTEKPFEPETFPPAAVVGRWMELAREAAWIPLPSDDSGSRDANWCAYVEALRKSTTEEIRTMGSNQAKRLLGLFRADPTREWLLRMIHGDGMPDIFLADVPWNPAEIADPSARMDAWILRLSSDLSPPNDADMANALAADIERSPATSNLGWVADAVQGARSHHLFARALFHLPVPLPEAIRSAALANVCTQRSAPSLLLDPTVWLRLDLPLPTPPKAVSSRPPPRLPSPHIQAVELQGIRSLGYLTLPLHDAPTAGRWIVLLGENGTGKTTILRSIALALMDPALAAGLVKSSRAPYIAHDREQAHVEVRASNAHFRGTFTQDAGAPPSETFEGKVTSEGDSKPERPLLFAYGCRRGSALGGAARAVSFRPGEAVETLFDEGASLIHAQTWLQGRALASKEQDAVSERLLFEAVRKELENLLPGVTRLDVRADGVILEGPAIGRTSLDGLSDGYVSMLGWVVDLVARWIDMRHRAKEPVGPNFFEQMEGIVLVDEIDLHLHPRWQMRVIDDLRRLFPRLTFVVTTHNPLTLLGARDGEVIVLRRADNDLEAAATEADLPGGLRIEAEQRNLAPGLTMDQILTGVWFGLESTLDKDTLALLEKHRAMLRADVPPNDADRLEIEAKLRKRLGGFADTSLERLAQAVAAKLLSERPRDRSPAGRERLRKTILETVALEAKANAPQPPAGGK